MMLCSIFSWCGIRSEGKCWTPSRITELLRTSGTWNFGGSSIWWMIKIPQVVCNTMWPSWHGIKPSHNGIKTHSSWHTTSPLARIAPTEVPWGSFPCTQRYVYLGGWHCHSWLLDSRRSWCKRPDAALANPKLQIRDFLELSSFWHNLIISALMCPEKAELFDSILRSKAITPKQPNIYFEGASYYANMWLEHSKQDIVLGGETPSLSLLFGLKFSKF